MKFLLLSRFGEGAHILHRIKQEGNTVELHVESELYPDVWEGLLPHIGNGKWENTLTKDTVVLFDSSGLGNIAEQLSKRGIKTFGSSEFADRLEKDRDFGIEYMERTGIDTPETFTFNNLDDGISFIKDASQDKRWVFKPSGEHATKLTYVAYDQRDMLGYLEYLKDNDEIKEFLLQEFIEGVAVSTEVWVQNGEIVHPMNHTIENKKLMNDNLGPSTGCSGNITWTDDGCFLTKKLSKLRVPKGYNGPIDLNCIITGDKKIYGLEWTPRIGLDATPTLLWGLYSGEVGKLISDLASGQQDEDMDFGTRVAGSVRLSIPPYPLEPKESEEIEDTSGIPLNNIPKLDSRDAYYYEIKAGSDGNLVHSCGIGLVMLGIGVSEHPESAIEKAEIPLEQARIPDKQYRTDLIGELTDCYEKFMNLGG